MQLKDLWKRYNRVENVAGINLSKFEQEVSITTKPLDESQVIHLELYPPDPVPMWMYEWTGLTDDTCILEFDMNSNVQDQNQVEQVIIENNGILHGIVSWLEWFDENLIWSMGSISSLDKIEGNENAQYRFPAQKQLLFACLRGYSVEKGDVAQIGVNFDAAVGELNISASLL